MKMLELHVLTQPALMSHDYMEIKTEVIINDKSFTLKEYIPDELCKNKELFKRMIDKQFYEAKSQICKYLAIK